MSTPRRAFEPESRPRAIATRFVGWSAPLIGWSGVSVRVHVSLAVVLVLALGVCWRSGEPIAWLTLAAYLTSLFVHEAAHVAAVARTRAGWPAKDDPVVLGPLGGMRVVGGAGDPRDRVFCAMAGPLASLAMVVVSLFSLAASGLDIGAATLLDPSGAIAAASQPGASPIAVLAPLMVLINWPLFAVNLAPAAPFDGGVALRSWLSVWMDRRAASDATCVSALLVAAGLLGAAGALVLTQSGLPLLAATLAVLAVVIAFGARLELIEAHDEWPDLADEGVGLGQDDRRYRSAGSLGERALRIDLLNDDEEEDLESMWDERRIDDILSKVHRRGLTGLTANERALLERASEHYQRRREAGD